MPLPEKKPNSLLKPEKWRQWLSMCAGPLFPLAFCLAITGKHSSPALLLSGIGVLYVYIGLILVFAARVSRTPTWLRLLSNLHWQTYVALLVLFGALYVTLLALLPPNFLLTKETINMLLIPMGAMFVTAMALVIRSYRRAIKTIKPELRPTLPKAALIAIAAVTLFLIIAWCFTHSINSALLALAAANTSYGITLLLLMEKIKREQFSQVMLCALPGAVLLWIALDLLWPSNWSPLFLLIATQALIPLGSNAKRRAHAKKLEATVNAMQMELAQYEGVTDPEQKAILDEIDKTMLYMRKTLVECREEGLLDDVPENR